MENRSFMGDRPEIDQFEMVVSTDHHVVWLDVSMVKIMGLQVHNP
jgi:hypothetical protein